MGLVINTSTLVAPENASPVKETALSKLTDKWVAILAFAYAEVLIGLKNLRLSTVSPLLHRAVPPRAPCHTCALTQAGRVGPAACRLW